MLIQHPIHLNTFTIVEVHTMLNLIIILYYLLFRGYGVLLCVLCVDHS